MRLIVILFLLLLLLFEGVLFLLFTTPGNTMLLPFANQYLHTKVPQVKIELTKLQLKPNSIGLIARVNQTVSVRAQGAFDLFKRDFDIDYILQANTLKTPTHTIKSPMHIKGKAKGNPDKLTLQGHGAAFDSTIHYALKLIDRIPQDIKLDITDADLPSLLTVAGQRPYSTGLLSLHADMPIFTPLSPKVEATLDIKNGQLNSTLLSRDFNLTLPPKSTYRTHFIIKTAQQSIGFTGTLNSKLFDLALSKGTYHLLNNTLSSHYALNIANLKALSTIAKMPLRGPLKVNGTLSLKNTLPTLTGTTKSFGGESSFRYSADTLTATLDKISNSTLLTMLGQPAYLSGTTTASTTLSSLKNLAGTFKMQTQGWVRRKAVKKAFDLDLGEKFSLSTGIKGKIKQGKVYTTLVAKTSMANLKVSPLLYDLNSASLYGKYLLALPDLSKLKPLTGKRYRGNMRINGKIEKKKLLHLTGHGKEFGGTIDFTLSGDRFKADASGVTVSKLMTMLDYPQVLEAISKAKVDYSLTRQSGTLHATLDNARLLPSQLTTLLKQFQIIDLTKERYNNSRFDARINKQRIDFTLEAKSKNSTLKCTTEMMP